MPTDNIFRNKMSVDTPYADSGVILYSSPTGNCQLFSLSEAKILFNNIGTALPQSKSKLIEKARQDFKDAAIKAGRKKLCLMDLKKGYIPYVKEVFKPDEIVLESEYTSSNGSYMCIFIVRINLSLY